MNPQTGVYKTNKFTKASVLLWEQDGRQLPLTFTETAPVTLPSCLETALSPIYYSQSSAGSCAWIILFTSYVHLLGSDMKKNTISSLYHADENICIHP